MSMDNSASVRHARNSISGSAVGAFDEKKLPFIQDGETSPDIETGEVSPAYDDNGPVEFEEKKDLKYAGSQSVVKDCFADCTQDVD